MRTRHPFLTRNPRQVAEKLDRAGSVITWLNTWNHKIVLFDGPSRAPPSRPSYSVMTDDCDVLFQNSRYTTRRGLAAMVPNSAPQKCNPIGRKAAGNPDQRSDDQCTPLIGGCFSDRLAYIVGGKSLPIFRLSWLVKTQSIVAAEPRQDKTFCRRIAGRLVGTVRSTTTRRSVIKLRLDQPDQETWRSAAEKFSRHRQC